MTFFSDRLLATTASCCVAVAPGKTGDPCSSKRRAMIPRLHWRCGCSNRNTPSSRDSLCLGCHCQCCAPHVGSTWTPSSPWRSSLRRSWPSCIDATSSTSTSPQLEELLHAFEHACQGRSACMLVAGYAGIGKTTLIQELYKPLVRQRGYFIAGKCDQLARNIPYHALIQAFQQLVQ